MEHITIDADLLSQLRYIAQPVELRGPDGTSVGVFTPVMSPEREALYARARSLFDYDKAKRVAAEHGEGRPLSDIWRDLEAREGMQ
jgi:hypothetical protein